MDIITRLPLECLERILESLHQREDLASLASLLRVNKYVAKVTLPYLYTEPYRPSLHGSKRNVGSSAPQDPAIFAGKLTPMLLSHSIAKLSSSPSSSQLPKALLLSFNVGSSGHNNSPLDYFAHIRDLCLERWAIGPHRTSIYVSSPFTSPEVMAYIQTDEFKSLCHMDRLYPQYVRRFHPETQLLLQYFRVILIREANWALASPILGQLRTLTVPVADIGRYLSVVEQLASLEHVWFRMDEVFDYESTSGRGENWSIIGTTPQGIEFTRKCKERKDAVMKDVIRFVKEHCRHFPAGTLKTARFSDAGLWPWVQQTFPEETQFEIFRSLPPLYRPVKLMPLNWLHFMVYPLTTDLGCVKEIEHRKTVSDSFERLRENRQFLQNCRSLTALTIPSLGQGSFAWAVQEKRDLHALNTNNTSNEQGCEQGQRTFATLLSNSSGLPAYLQHGLVPLEIVEIREFKEPFTDEVDDIAFAFSQTLKHLKADASSFAVAQQQQHTSPLQPRSIYFGRGWVHLPVLSQLSLNAKNARLIIDRQLLVHCPNVEYVTLTDETHQYRCQDLLEKQLCVPASLAQLKMMSLVGWPALTFHPDTLHTTPNITHLKILTYPRNDACYIPPIEELNRSYGLTSSSPSSSATLNNGAGAGAGAGAGILEALPETTAIIRPHWSWDWHLPQLNSLKLTSEFAYRFQFRMLRGCPALDVLDLDIATLEGEHPRFLNTSDFHLPVTGTVDNEQRRQLRIIAPHLRTLRLKGRWMFTNQFLWLLLTQTFPSLAYLTEAGWGGGVTVAGLIRCIRASPNRHKLMQVEMMTLPEIVYSEQRRALGMVTEMEADESKRLPVTLYFTEMQYALLVDPEV
ncbi:hypothetical protein BGZ95_011039 [Linnemannia exigua]|uniref:F-box domain-containing protein n=1 Tax=Linnemannia exigua TaxID=604196 RepID=A0AAD4DAN0_9FUNG|nr:hypothetical protein BGZ95_011039 [Linnemannia exigua]